MDERSARTVEIPDYQIGWAVLTAIRLLDTLKRNFLFYAVKILQAYPGR